ncbi:molybdenum cofactor guanylyltransferase [Microbacterium sp. NPDC087589]|uniref:molybdenum cofactor guanylyltransferase n=1 Tax=Microbacterium sp. NPDC087589 TaxID=3364191 RepID=UPI0038049C39
MTSADAANAANAATSASPASPATPASAANAATSAHAANPANAATSANPANAADAATPASSATAAIILAGGRASRLDGAAKPLLEVGGRTLLDRAIAALAGCDPIVVVGPPAPVHGTVVWTRETPEFGGPVAGIAAGLASTESADVFVLAADLPHAEEAVALLRRHPPLARGEDGICLADESGRMQWLIGLYRTDALRRALGALPDGGRDASIRSLLAGLALTALPAGDLATDVDTWDDLERARTTAQTQTATAQSHTAAAPTQTTDAQTQTAAAQIPPRGRAQDEETT